MNFTDVCLILFIVVLLRHCTVSYSPGTYKKTKPCIACSSRVSWKGHVLTRIMGVLMFLVTEHKMDCEACKEEIGKI